MTTSGYWFAWFPVIARARQGKRWAWLETVHRERLEASCGDVGEWRYYALN